MINGEIISSATGNTTYKFTGTGDYKVYVSAYNEDQYVSTSTTITVKVSPKLAWSDEFDKDGAPDPTKWIFETGTGQGGWGNNELQHYTNRLENSAVSNGVLKIFLRKESFQGSNYTSARLTTRGLYEFKYGRIEVRAKLPTGGGTWPAVWMLGADYQTNLWPACGEIDVMEHIGNQQNTIMSALHLPGNYGGNALTSKTAVANVSSEFHVYAADWTPHYIKFYVDGNLFFTFNQTAATPFHKNFFIIMNLAMGGNLGGTVDPALSSAKLEVDYVRVYQ